METCTYDLKFVDKKAILSVSGKINGITSPSFEKKINEIFEGSTFFERIVFDFTNVQYISSSGLRVILYTRKKMNSLFGENDDTDARVIVKNVQDSVREVFDMTGFDSIVEVQ